MPSLSEEGKREESGQCGDPGRVGGAESPDWWESVSLAVMAPQPQGERAGAEDSGQTPVFSKEQKKDRGRSLEGLEPPVDLENRPAESPQA